MGVDRLWLKDFKDTNMFQGTIIFRAPWIGHDTMFIL